MKISCCYCVCARSSLISQPFLVCHGVNFAQVEGGEILAHRDILIINSEYFRSMFRDGFHETYIREIPIPPESVDRHSAETLVNFMYTGQFSG